jgi:hypothetical protein
MVASAYAARMAARAAEYGVDVGSVRVDMKRVMAAVMGKHSRKGVRNGTQGSSHRLERSHERRAVGRKQSGSLQRVG